jgi:hypothetical protein
MTHVGSRMMCLDPDVVPLLAGFPHYAILGIFDHVLSVPSAVLWIRIRSDPGLFAGSGLGSRINHFGSGSGQSGSGMNLIPNFFVKK